MFKAAVGLSIGHGDYLLNDGFFLLPSSGRILVICFQTQFWGNSTLQLCKALWIFNLKHFLLQKFFIGEPSHRFLQKEPSEYCTNHTETEKNPDIH